MNSEIVRDKIILPSWQLIKEDSKVKKFYLIPWLLSVIFLTALLTYQAIYTYVVIWNNQEVVLEQILHFLESKYLVEVLIISIVFLVLYFLLVPIFEWWLIKYIDLKNKNEPVWMSDAIWYWLNKFLPIFEYGNLFSEFKLINILNFYLFTIRFVGVDYIKVTTIAYLILGVLWTMVNILFVYSKYSIMLNNKLVFQAIWESIKITILNLKTTIRLFFLVFVLNLRVLINFLLFLFFPILIVVTVWLISSKFLVIFSVSILLTIFILLIICVWYLTAVLDVFKTSLWYYAYNEWRKKIDDDDEDE
jgi:hypothetical protein